MQSNDRRRQRARWTPWILIGLIAGNGHGLAQTAGEQDGALPPRISIWVYNYARVPGKTLGRAEKESERIFRQIGVEISWGNCNSATADIHVDANCTQQPGPLNFGLRIVPGFALAQGVTDDKTMGLAIGYLASVSYRWVSEEAEVMGIAPSDILGPAIAHELGHLLLRQPGHSFFGIMHARWSREDFQRAPLGTFSFIPEQAEAIRLEISTRLQGQAAVVSAAAKASK